MGVRKTNGAGKAALSEGLQLTPVPRQTVQDRVYLELRKALICGLFEPGQVLTIQELAASLDTSTMPVREALHRLISEHALEALPNRSVRVPLADLDRLDDLLRARILIEGTALELATPRLKRGEFGELKALTRNYDRAMAMRGSQATETELELNRAFHFLIYRASGSAVLLPIIESLWLQCGPYVRAAVRAFDQRLDLWALHYHAEIVAALEAQDVAAARAALAADIGRAFDMLRSPQGEPKTSTDDQRKRG
ncbi:MAG TPA: GntR family transcriptional regulator [Stellaceae bacterium]|nr:GntR family transcriptional regulator [Stellaceae bacterium]